MYQWYAEGHRTQMFSVSGQKRFRTICIWVTLTRFLATMVHSFGMKRGNQPTLEVLRRFVRCQWSWLSRWSSKFRAVTLEKCDRWDARIGQFLAKRTHDQKLLREKVMHLIRVAGIERIRSAAYKLHIHPKGRAIYAIRSLSEAYAERVNNIRNVISRLCGFHRINNGV